MHIQPQFTSFDAFYQFRRRTIEQQRFSPPNWLPGQLDSSMLSSRADFFLMMNTFSSLMQGFNGRYSMPMYQPPLFGIPGRNPEFGPRQCTFGPPAQAATPPTPEPVSARVTSPPKNLASVGARVRPLAQSNGSSCGQASVAMAVNSLTGKSLNDRDINGRYGFGLLSALNGESRSSGYQWRDGGNFNANKWPLLEKKLNQEKTPVIIGLNGPQFSPSGRGHIVTLLSVNGNNVRYADPADGTIKTTTRQAIERAPSHPDGKFIFYASKA